MDKAKQRRTPGKKRRQPSVPQPPTNELRRLKAARKARDLLAGIGYGTQLVLSDLLIVRRKAAGAKPSVNRPRRVTEDEPPKSKFRK